MNLGTIVLLFVFVAAVLYVAVFLPMAVKGGRYAWRLLEFFEAVSTSFDVLFKRGSAAWVEIVTADTEEIDDVRCIFAAANGDLMTLVRVRGVSQVQDVDEIASRIESIQSSLTSYFAQGGYYMQIRFAYDGSGGVKSALDCMAPNRKSAERLKLDVDFLLEDWARQIGSYTATQETYVAVWTTASALQSAQQRKDAAGARKKVMGQTALSGNSMNPNAATEALRAPHTSFVRSLMNAFAGAGILADVLDVHTAAREMRAAITPATTPSDWKACLPGDPLNLRTPLRSDMSSILYPRLDEQLFPVPIEKDGEYIVVGGRRYAFVYVSLWPQTPKPFGSLIAFLQRSATPHVMSVLLSGNALGGTGIKSALASLFAIGSTSNKMLMEALKEVNGRILDGETFVGGQIVFATWTREDDPIALLRERQAALSGAVASWGACEPSSVVGDPALALTATLPGLTRRSPAPRTPVPLQEVIPMLPIERIARIWDDGGVLYRAGTKLFPFRQGSSLQAAPVEVGFAPMGGGKSVNIGVVNFGFILQADVLPYLSISDIGPSSKGLIETIKMALPPSLRYLAQYHRLRYEPRFTVNIFDLPLGANRPLPMHEKFLVNFLCLLAGDASGKTDEAIPGLATACIKSAYEDRLPENAPRVYSRGVNAEVDEIVEKVGMEIHTHTTWYAVRDFLFDQNHFHEATLAQRYAVPTLSEVASKAQSSIIAEGYKKESNGETITYFFFRKIAEAISRVPILDGASRFSLDDARIVALDLDEVAPNSGGEASGWLSAVAVMLSRHLLASRFFLMPEDANLFEARYIPWQRDRITRLRESPKRLVYDELQRFSQNKAVVDQFVADAGTMVREGRKWDLHLAFYSQSVTHIPDDIVNLSFTRYIFGGSKAEIEIAAKKLHLSRSAQQACLRIGKPGRHGANFVAVFRVAGVKNDESVQFLTSTIGTSLLWAFETTPENSAVRNRLYEKWGVRKTLTVLGRHYPGGVKDEVKALAAELPQSGEEGSQSAVSAMVDQILERFDRVEIGG